MSGTVTIDANLLLLLIVGSTSRNYIEKHKRLRNQYTPEDFDLLVAAISQFDDVVLLPNTLTEVSNLLAHIENPARSKVFANLRGFIATVAEKFVPSVVAAARPEFIKLGLADATLLELTSIKESGFSPTLLTVDLDLAIAAEMNGHNVSNFNHFRDL